MNILRKEKLRFRIMNKRVTKRDFEYLKGLCLKCVSENPDIAKRLDEIHRLIHVYFFYETTDPNAANSLRNVLNDFTIKYLTKPTPAFAESRKNIGCIMVFVKYFKEFAQKREDIIDIDQFNQGHFFEELCHLVQHKGDTSVNPNSYWILWDIYTRRNLQKYGNEIIRKLDDARDHYEVFLMMIKACPKEWVERLCRYFMRETPYEQDYEQWKRKFPIEIVYAGLIADTLWAISVLSVGKKVPKDKLSNKHKKLLDSLIKTGKLDIEKKKSLIEKDMGSSALSLINSLDESIFKTSDIFFSVVLNLWKSLHLV